MSTSFPTDGTTQEQLDWYRWYCKWQQETMDKQAQRIEELEKEVSDE